MVVSQKYGFVYGRYNENDRCGQKDIYFNSQ